jgi:hypothetical protein
MLPIIAAGLKIVCAVPNSQRNEVTSVAGVPRQGVRSETLVPFGMASVTFPTTTTATIRVNGYNFSVEREQFGFDFTSTT